MIEISAEFVRAAVQAALISAGAGSIVLVTEASHGPYGPTFAVSFAAPETEPTT